MSDDNVPGPGTVDSILSDACYFITSLCECARIWFNAIGHVYLHWYFLWTREGIIQYIRKCAPSLRMREGITSWHRVWFVHVCFAGYAFHFITMWCTGIIQGCGSTRVPQPWSRRSVGSEGRGILPTVRLPRYACYPALTKWCSRHVMLAYNQSYAQTTHTITLWVGGWCQTCTWRNAKQPAEVYFAQKHTNVIGM